MIHSPAVVWLLDRGAEDKLPVSISTLRLNAPSAWSKWHKVVLDAGLTGPMYKWLQSLESEGVFVAPVPEPSGDDVVGGDSSPAARVMRVRVGLTTLLQELAAAAAIPPIERFLHVDPDVVFLGSPEPLFDSPSRGEHVWAMKEWDWRGDPSLDIQDSSRLSRRGTFAEGRSGAAAQLAQHLGITKGELHAVETYNSGVWVGSAGSALAENWTRAYRELNSIDRAEGGGFLNPYSAEQVALSVAIYRGDVICRSLPRKYNQFPPRPPHDWPRGTLMAHFITFERNYRGARYGLWFDCRRAVLAAGLCPRDLVSDGDAQITSHERS